MLSDLTMPRMSGLELLAAVRERSASRVSRTFVVSGHYPNEEAPQGLHADAYFEKAAYIPAQLLDTIKSLLNRSRTRPRVAAR